MPSELRLDSHQRQREKIAPEIYPLFGRPITRDVWGAIIIAAATAIVIATARTLSQNSQPGPAGDQPRSHFIWRLVRQIAGWFMVGLGLIGLVLPFLQGILFLAIGLSLLAADSPWARRLLSWLKEKFPGKHKAVPETAGKTEEEPPH